METLAPKLCPIMMLLFITYLARLGRNMKAVRRELESLRERELAGQRGPSPAAGSPPAAAGGGAYAEWDDARPPTDS